jgi:hypothetical protein
VASRALARRALEDRIHVAGLAGLQAVRPGELESRREVVELGTRALRHRTMAGEREQEKHGKSMEPVHRSTPIAALRP